MADDIASLVIEIDSKGVAKADNRLDKLEAQSKKTEKSTKNLTSANKRQTQSFIQMAAKIGAAMIAYRAITGVTRTFISNTIKQEQAMRQLEVAVESTGGAAGFTAVELREMAQELQNVTTFGDEAVMEMQAILLTFTNIGKDTLPGTTEAVANLAIRMGTDLKSAAIQLGKALNDPIANLSALSRSGIQFTKDQKSVINSLVEAGEMAEAQRIILKELDVQFGGSARAARDTFGGALSSLGNTFGDLFEASEATSTSLANVVNAMNDGLKTSGFYEAAVKGLAQTFWEMSSNSDTISEKLLDNADQAWNLKNNLEDIEKINREGGVIQKALYGGPEKQAKAQKLYDDKIEEMRALASQIKIIDQAGKVKTITETSDEGALAVAQQAINAAMILGEVQHNAIMETNRQEAFDREWEQLNAQWDREDEGIAARERQETAHANAIIAIRSGMLGNLSLLMQSDSKKMFEVGKAASIAQALIKGQEAVVSSYAAGAAVGGPILGGAYAATAALATASQIQAIRSQSIGGGGSVTASSTPTAPAVPAMSIGADEFRATTAPASQPAATINIYSLTGTIDNESLQQVEERLYSASVLSASRNS